jgi:hypothetical protein
LKPPADSRTSPADPSLPRGVLEVIEVFEVLEWLWVEIGLSRNCTTPATHNTASFARLSTPPNTVPPAPVPGKKKGTEVPGRAAKIRGPRRSTA